MNTYYHNVKMVKVGSSLLNMFINVEGGVYSLEMEKNKGLLISLVGDLQLPSYFSLHALELVLDTLSIVYTIISSFFGFYSLSIIKKSFRSTLSYYQFYNCSRPIF